MRTLIVLFCLVAYASAHQRMRRQIPFEDCLNKPGAYCDYSCKSGYSEDPTLRCGIVTNRRCCVPQTTLPPFVTTIVPPLHICGISKYGTECGKTTRTSRIVGGQDAYANEFPWLVSIQIDSQHSCGGSILAYNWILTAANCFKDLSVDSIVTLSKIRVVAGEHRLLNSDTTEVYARVAKIVIKRGYDPDTMSNNIAMIKLKEPGFVFNSNMREICLPAEVGNLDRKLVVVAGWGVTSEGHSILANTLQKVQLATINQKECEEKLAPQKVEIDASMICASGDAKDTCQGDVGSPLIMRQSDGQSFTQVGIVSHGLGCMSGYPGVYTRVSSFTSWISGVMATE